MGLTVGLIYLFGAVVMLLVVPAVIMVTQRKRLSSSAVRGLIIAYVVVIGMVFGFVLLLDYAMTSR